MVFGLFFLTHRPSPFPVDLGHSEDFEWTCDGPDEERQVHSDDVEIIEFSYVIYDAQVGYLENGEGDVEVMDIL